MTDVHEFEYYAPDGGGGSIRFSSACTVGQRSRHMEDEHILAVSLPEGRVWLSAVFDGHGGGEVSRFLRTSFAGMLCASESWRRFASAAAEAAEAAEAELLGEAVAEALAACDDRILADPEMMRAGSTALIVLVTRTHIVTANVGDSRACLRRRRAFEVLSRDHKPSLDEEAERIFLAGGRVNYAQDRVYVDGVRSGLSMSRALGDRDFKVKGAAGVVVCTPEISVVPRRDARFVLLATDGVWDAFRDKECVYAMRALTAHCHSSVRDAAAVAAFVRECVDYTAPCADNITAVLIRFVSLSRGGSASEAPRCTSC